MREEKRFTQLLKDWQEGSTHAADELVPIVAEELRVSAERLMSRERGGHTLQPTALVNETYMRLARSLPGARFPSRNHFYALSVQIMRKFLVDYARRKNSQKRGNDPERVALEPSRVTARGHDPSELLFLDELLDRLRNVDQAAADVFCRNYILGLDRATVSADLGMPLRTVDRKIVLARTWIRDKLLQGREGGSQ